MELVILIGLPAAGKSTFYRERFAATHAHVSKDKMPRSARKEERQRREILEALAAGRSIIVDNVNAAAVDRSWLIAQAHARGARVIAYFFDATPKECLLRNQGRQGRERVPPPAIFSAAKRLERPSRNEGFDELFRVRVRQHNEERGFEVEPLPE
jgi:predicted kinase